MIRPSDTSGRPAPYYAAAGIAALIMCALIVAVHRDSFRTLVSAHGLLHAAIAQEFEGVWLPVERPENPFFAGEPLPYYWFYHFVAAKLAAAAGVHPLLAFEALGLLAVAIVWFAGVGIGRTLGWRLGPSLAIGFLAFAGTNAFGSVFLLIKLAVGRPWPIDNGEYLWGLAHPVMGMARWNDPSALYGPLVNFFLNNSSRGLALATELLVVLAVLRYLKTRRRPWLAATGIGVACCTAFSPIVGLLTGASLGGVLVVRCALGSDPADRRPALWAASVLLSGCALSVPTYHHLVTQATQAGLVLGLRPGLLATVLVTCGPLLALSVAALMQPAAERQALVLLTGVGGALLVGNALLAIPGSNESDLSHVAALLLAVPAAGAFQAADSTSCRRTRMAAGLLVMLFASTPAVVIWSYWRRPPVSVALDGAGLRAEAGSARADAYDWIRRNTPETGVFVMAEDLLASVMVGNVPDFPALTDRTLFTSNEPYYVVSPYEDADRRRRIAATLLAGELPEGLDRAYVAALRRPIFVLLEHPARDVLTHMETWAGKPLFDDDRFVVIAVPN